MAEPVKIDVWSDIACPWCYIGKRNLDTAVAGAEVPVEVEYHSFQLDPDAVSGTGLGAVEYLSSIKGIPEKHAQAMVDRVIGFAAAVGLTYDYGVLQPANTAKAHELLHHARTHGLQAQMKERLLRAHFTDGLDVGDPEVLADLAAEVGLDRDEVARSLASGEYGEAVDADVRAAAANGVRGVPFFVLDGRYGMSGAQPAEAFAAAIAQVAAERAGATS